MFAQRGFSAEDEQTGHGRDNPALITANESQRTVQLVISQSDERALAAIALNALPETFPLQRIEILQRRRRDRESRIVEKAQVRLTLREFMGVERDAFRQAVRSETATLQ